MAQQQDVVIKYQGSNGGYLRIDTNGTLHLSKTQSPHPNMYSFERILKGGKEDESGYYDLVMFRSSENKTKYITGYGNGWGYVVTGEPTINNNAFSLWEQRSYSMETRTGEENGLFALYNPAEQCYFVITIDPDSLTPEFRLTDNIDDVKTNGAFAIGPP